LDGVVGKEKSGKISTSETRQHAEGLQTPHFEIQQERIAKKEGVLFQVVFVVQTGGHKVLPRSKDNRLAPYAFIYHVRRYCTQESLLNQMTRCTSPERSAKGHDETKEVVAASWHRICTIFEANAKRRQSSA